jgi:hypothetical protein
VVYPKTRLRWPICKGFIFNVLGCDDARRVGSRYIQKLESCGLPVVVVEHSTESLSSSDASGCCRSAFDWSDKLVSQALMISLSMVVGNEFSDGVPQAVFAKENHLLQTILFDRTNRSAYAFRFGERGGSFTD